MAGKANKAHQEDIQIFFTQDSPKFPRLQSAPTHSYIGTRLEGWEPCVLQNYTIHEHGEDYGDFVYDLEDLLDGQDPRALDVWKKTLRNEETEGSITNCRIIVT